ncbi:MAG: gamma-glutamylcyclotransferase, partial [Candidatus Dadabacteria bacterium]|nr:gamma-glutamylcyclotransferase [Candidatus Dadabacteria bacterium]NIV40848.1 hypothetical protein [Candidatus Dadabacteria bacterium]NIX15057.1 hypothetical protein [Candidatus Dadabacteria bacterium]
ISSLLNGAGHANIVEQDDGLVKGILYEVTEQCIRNLDRYESCPREYDRKLLGLRLPHGGERLAYVYIAQPGRTAQDLLPTKDYLSHLLRAEGLLPTNYMKKL